ncbi:MAG: hypothetical protein JRF33_06280 [Deltaproteobacteria bacterium]|nr:hypothetical protein [Deltaproteobacteria bacterium]
MHVTTKVLFVSLSLSIALMGCKNPCEDAIDEIRDEVTAFLSDTDPMLEGAQPCENDPICDLARAALDTRWPHFDCTSCDAAEILLCNCFDDNAWMTSFDDTYTVPTPHYPASLYCLAKYYQQRELCECAPCLAPNEEKLTDDSLERPYCERGDGTRWYLDGDCHEYNSAFRLVLDDNGDPIRVCDPNSTEGILKAPILQQTDMCNAIIAAFECESFDADLDGIPDQYDASDPNGQDKSAKKMPENVECIAAPTAEDWVAWFDAPCSLYDNGTGGVCKFFIDDDGFPRYEDDDEDGVSNSCDNCPGTPNGFDCLKIPFDFDRFSICDADGNGVLTAQGPNNDLDILSATALEACLVELNRSAPFLKQCDVNGDLLVTREELEMGNQFDYDAVVDTPEGDACEPI